VSRLDEIKARAEQVHWTSTSIEQATARMASSAADVPWLIERVQELSGAICWDTTCLNCASLLDSNYDQYVRAEIAEAEVERLTDLCDEFRKREESQDCIRERLTAEVERLERWKFEACEVMSGLRELGRALGLGLGVQITGPAALAEVERLTAERDALAAQVARVESLAGQWERLATTAINPDSREWLQACSETLRECLSGWQKMHAAIAGSDADTGEQEAGHRCEPYYSRSQCGQCGWQEQWCATCSRQMCGCATETTDQEDQA